MAARSSGGEPSWLTPARREGRLRFRRHGGNRGNGSCRGAIVSMPRCPAGESVQTGTRVRQCGSTADKGGCATGSPAPSGGGRSWSQPVESRSPGNGKVERRVGANRRGAVRPFRCFSLTVPRRQRWAARREAESDVSATDAVAEAASEQLAPTSAQLSRAAQVGRLPQTTS